MRNTYRQGSNHKPIKHFYKCIGSIWELVRCGDKDIEFRIYDDKAKRVKVSDTLVLTNNSTGQQIKVQVVGIVKGSDWASLYNYAVKNGIKVGIKNAIELTQIMSEAYANIPKKEYDGVVAFIIKHY